MAPVTRSSDFDARFLDRLVGTKVTTFDDIDPPQEPSAVSTASMASLPADSPLGISPPGISPLGSPLRRICCTWVITEKLSERAVYLTEEDVEWGIGTLMTIPITGTEWANPDTRAQRAGQDPTGLDKTCGEREAFKLLMRQGCNSVPRFLGYNEKIQAENDLIPGGYTKYLVWEKVPGESLTEEFFWSLDRSTRDDIRARFRVAYEEILRCRVVPQMSRISKIIYDQTTGNVCVKGSTNAGKIMLGRFANNFSRISGFRMGWPIRSKFQWSDTRYMAYGLAKRPEEDWNWRQHPENWEL
ncbi:hypothetical protein ANOM_009255 [Aspergillus nomiae NRRL 13137]|uniref:Protein kinase domain-containing protein n=1 Tax=Aspergillus nomiae NRRL (strain ATCC 15546 / NRRL 13137 / CBS 260.88 / M93) TaxID=1509407 RepID=A0A0L1ITJ4_ASPN3|nr:uncharacterized protein ANOM_009255 [Aspergillus nomiae NRRL 13137]KNG82809.1 hypothetical protein ANOM_009255 [Aspergillus nomiae NRRL 13137]